MLSAILSITVLPACLGILGKHVDALGVRTLFRVPFLANWKISAAYLTGSPTACSGPRPAKRSKPASGASWLTG